MIKWFVLVAFFLTVLSFLLIRDKNRESSLKKFHITYAVISDVYHGSSKGGGFIEIKYHNNKNQLILSEHIGRITSCNNSLNVGDTVIIKYSLQDNSIATIIGCRWNRYLRDKYTIH